MTSESVIKSLDLKQQQYYCNGWTNSLLFHQTKNKKLYFLPAYLRLKCKNFVSMDIKNLTGTVNIDIILSVYYGELPQFQKEYLKNHIHLRFNKGQSIRLKEGLDIQIVDQYVEKTYRFTLRKIINAQLDVDILWSPFQIIRYVISVAISKIEMPGQNIQIHFNLMVNQQNKFMQASYSQQSYYGEYDLAQALIQTQYSNWSFYSKLLAAKSQTKQKNYMKYRERLKFDQTQNRRLLYLDSSNLQDYSVTDEQKIEAFHYAHFIFPLYRKPYSTLVSLFFPVIILSIINLGIFFQNDGMAKRIQNIAIILVSYVALIPTIRDSLPPNDKITFSEVLIFSFVFNTMLAFIQTMQIKDEPNFFQHWTDDPYFLAAMGITIGCSFILVFCSLLFLIYYEPSYNRQVQKCNFAFIRSQWMNKGCDKYFKRAVMNGYELNIIQQKININKMILQI